MNAAYVPIQGSSRVPLPGAQVLGRVNPGKNIEVTLKLRRQKPLPDIDARPTKPMSRQDLAQFGANDADITKVVDTLGALGLQLLSKNAATRSVRMSGPVLVVDGHAEPNGGTSAATPLVASLIVLINATGKRVGYLTPLLYAAGTQGKFNGSVGCDDVVSGDNVTAHAGGYHAATGYDACCGWGTPNGKSLAQLIT